MLLVIAAWLGAALIVAGVLSRGAHNLKTRSTHMWEEDIPQGWNEKSALKAYGRMFASLREEHECGGHAQQSESLCPYCEVRI